MRMLCALSLGIVLCGCGGGSDYEGPTRFPLSGKVTFDGQPIDGGSIAFLPQGGTGRPAGGLITNGAYSIPEGQGVPEGAYRVEILWGRPTGNKILDAEDTGEMIDETAQVIPARYNSNSELTANVAAGTTTFDFDLKAD